MNTIIQTPTRSTITVLICEDHPAMRAALQDVIGLRSSLRVVGEAANGHEAVTEARRLQPDVVLLDLAMPLRTGLEALVELGQVAPAAKIIVFSGFSASSVADEVLNLGAVVYLEKGASPDTINDAIEHAASRTDDSPPRRGSSSVRINQRED